MNTYKVVFQGERSVTIKADRYDSYVDRPAFVTFYAGEDNKCVGTVYLGPGDYIRLMDTEKECSCTCSKPDTCLSDPTSTD